MLLKSFCSISSKKKDVDVIFEGVDYLASEDINNFVPGKQKSLLLIKKNDR